MANSFGSVKVSYKFIDGWHVFSSDDVPGLYVASKEGDKAYQDVATAMKMLLEANEGLSCEAHPQTPLADFFAAVRAAQVKPRRRAASKVAKAVVPVYRRPRAFENQQFAVTACQ